MDSLSLPDLLDVQTTSTIVSACSGRVNAEGFFSNPEMTLIPGISQSTGMPVVKESYKIEYVRTETEKLVQFIGKDSKHIEYSFLLPIPAKEVSTKVYLNNDTNNVLGVITGTAAYSHLQSEHPQVIPQLIEPVFGYKYLDIHMKADEEGKIIYEWNHNAAPLNAMHQGMTKIDGTMYYVFELRNELRRIVSKLYITEKFDLRRLKVGQNRHLAFVDYYPFAVSSKAPKTRETCMLSICSILMFWESYLKEISYEANIFPVKTTGRRWSEQVKIKISHDGDQVSDMPNSPTESTKQRPRRWSGHIKAKISGIGAFLAITNRNK